MQTVVGLGEWRKGLNMDCLKALLLECQRECGPPTMTKLPDPDLLDIGS